MATTGFQRAVGRLAQARDEPLEMWRMKEGDSGDTTSSTIPLFNDLRGSKIDLAHAAIHGFLIGWCRRRFVTEQNASFVQ